MKNKSNRLVFGGVLLILGMLFLVDQLNLFSTFNINIWNVISFVWPVLILYLGAKLLIEKNTTGGIVLLVLGFMFLGSSVFSFNFFSMLWPMIIIAVAISILLNPDREAVNKTESKSVSSNSINEDVIFWGLEKKIVSEKFEGGEVNCIFGGGKIDLTETKISKDGAVLEVNAIFGGIEIHVPKSMNVVTNGTGIFGGWSPSLKGQKNTGPVLEITGAAIFGGVDIKNK